MSSDNTKGRSPARPIQANDFVSRQHNLILRLLYIRQRPSTPRLRLRYRTGFSLLELLIVINLLGLMLTLSWPSMQEMLARQHAQSYIRQFQQHLQFARIMAISSGRVVTFCPLHDNKCLNQWWQIPIHINQQQKNKEQVLIRILDRPRESHWLYYNREQIQFRQDGSLQALQNGTFVYCAKQYPWHYTLTISQAGRSQSEFIAAPCPQ